jgi:hypothetical protein
MDTFKDWNEQHQGDICQDDYEHITQTGRYAQPAQPDIISIDTAGELDAAWVNAGQPADGLRIYGLRRSTYTVTYLAVPGNDKAPCYIYGKSGYYHVTGPTLAEWKAEQIALDNARRYEAQAADSAAQAEQLPEPHKGWANSNAALFAETAAFYRSQAAQIASR